MGGRSVVEGGLMIDLSLMKGVYVNAAARTAVVEGGALWKDFNREAQLHGLATTGGVVGTTGVAGLTLGGSLGWLMAKYAGDSKLPPPAAHCPEEVGLILRTGADDLPVSLASTRFPAEAIVERHPRRLNFASIRSDRW